MKLERRNKMDWQSLIEKIWDALPYSIRDVDYEPSKKVCYAEFDVEGDWKHDHLRFKYILEDICEENNVSSIITDIQYFDDDGSDYYRAVYEVALKVKR